MLLLYRAHELSELRTALTRAILFEGPQNALLLNCTLPVLDLVTRTCVESATCAPKFGSTKAVNSPLVMSTPHLSAEST